LSINLEFPQLTSAQGGILVNDQAFSRGVSKLFPSLAYLLTKHDGSDLFGAYVQVTSEEQTKRVKELLSLGDAQAAALLQIYEHWQDESSRVWESGEENSGRMGGAMMLLMVKADKQIDSLLTADQKRTLIHLGGDVE
jgi:hypothetical protein